MQNLVEDRAGALSPLAHFDFPGKMRCEGDRLELGRKRPSETVVESDRGERAAGLNWVARKQDPRRARNRRSAAP
jgi:hypothetical protein